MTYPVDLFIQPVRFSLETNPSLFVKRIIFVKPIKSKGVEIFNGAII
jgi:hypothetical protein